MLARNYITVLWNLVSVLNYKHSSNWTVMVVYLHGLQTLCSGLLPTLLSISVEILHFISIELKNSWMTAGILDQRFVAGVCFLYY